MTGPRASLIAVAVAATTIAAGTLAGSAAAGGDIFIPIAETHRIPDKGHGKATVTATSPAGTISMMFIGVRIKHPQTRDLKLSLKSPEGVTTVMTNRHTKGANFGEPGEGCNGNLTLFHSEFGQPLALGTAPYDDSFTPVEDLSDYYGHSAAGKWKLTARDLKKGNTGKIKCFVISFYTGP